MNAINEFRKTKLYNFIGIVIIITLWSMVSWTVCSSVYENQLHEQRVTNDTSINPSLAYRFALNKDGTLTIHRLSDKKNFTVKLDKGDK